MVLSCLRQHDSPALLAGLCELRRSQVSNAPLCFDVLWDVCEIFLRGVHGATCLYRARTVSGPGAEALMSESQLMSIRIASTGQYISIRAFIALAYAVRWSS
jgi:hypothetical protein